MRKIARICALIAVEVAVILIGLELAVRVVKPAPLFEVISVTTGDKMQYELTPNPLLIYRPRPGTGDLNAQGYRGPLHDFQRSGQRLRMVLIGDSVPEGAEVSPSARFSTLLENDRRLGLEVVNLGVRGYNLIQYYEYLAETGVKYKPDMVLVGITYNDLSVAAWEIENIRKKLRQIANSKFYETYYGASDRVERFLLQNSHVYRYIRFISSAKSEQDYVDSFPGILGKRVSPTMLDETLAKFEKLSRESSFPITFVIFPTLADPADAYEIGRAAERHGFPVWDLHGDTVKTSNPPPKDWFVPNDPCHFSIHGHEEIAAKLAEKLLEPNSMMSKFGARLSR